MYSNLNQVQSAFFFVSFFVTLHRMNVVHGGWINDGGLTFAHRLSARSTAFDQRSSLRCVPVRWPRCTGCDRTWARTRGRSWLRAWVADTERESDRAHVRAESLDESFSRTLVRLARFATFLRSLRSLRSFLSLVLRRLSMIWKWPIEQSGIFIIFKFVLFFQIVSRNIGKEIKLSRFNSFWLANGSVTGYVCDLTVVYLAN